MPEPSDERALFRAVLGRTNDCPGIEELASPDQTAAVRKHLDGCARCRAELALLHEFETAEPAVEEAAQVQWIKSELRRRSQEIVSAPEPAARSPWWGEWIGRLFAPEGRRALSWGVAALLLVLAASVYLTRRGGVERPLTPGGAPVWRSGQFAALSPVGDLAASPTAFRWEAVPGAATYLVQLIDVTGAQLWSAETAATTVEIPDKVRARLTRGGSFQWSVAARNAAGEKVAATDLQNFHIAVTSR